MRWELSSGTRDAGQHRHTGPGTAARGVWHTGVRARVRACVCWHGTLCLRVRGLRVQARARCTASVCQQLPRLPPCPRKPTHRQSPPQPVATWAQRGPSRAVPCAGRCCPLQPAASAAAPPGAAARHGCFPRAAAGLLSHTIPSGPRAGPESSSSPSSTPPPPLQANTTSDDSTPQSTT